MFISVIKDETSKIVFSSFTDDNWLIVSFFTDEVVKITLSSLLHMTQQNLVPHLLRITTWSVGCDLFHRWSSKINVVICLVNWYKSFWQITQQNLVSNILRFFVINASQLLKGSFRIYGLGGRHIPQILISLANDLICANDFIRVPLFFLRIPKNLKSKIFRPPFATRPKFFAPPSRRVQILSPPLNSKNQICL